MTEFPVPEIVEGRRYGRRLFAVVALVVAALDQVTKLLAVEGLQYGLPQPLVRGFLNLTLTRNEGGAWGVMAGSHRLLAMVALLLTLVLLAWGVSSRPRTRWLNVALALLLGGAVGNLIDRLRLEYVVDFIDFTFWPTFNLADIAITCGAIMILVQSLRGGSGCPAPPADREDQA